jgi:glycosyltransferase involved in cell wall biosynthesis
VRTDRVRTPLMPSGDGRRITFVVDSDAWGGAEVYVRHLLARADGLGWSAGLVCSAPVAAEFRDVVPADRLDVVPLARHQGHAPVIEVALRGQRPSVVLVNLVDPASNAAALAAALAVAPTAATLHLPGDVPEGAAGMALRGCYRRLAGVLTPSHEGWAQVTGELGVPAARVSVVANGVDVPANCPGPAGGAPPLVGAVGRLTLQKGFDVLLAAVRSLDAAEPGRLTVAVAGRGREADALAAAAVGLPVSFRGFVRDVPGFLRELDVFCLPSRREALPLALLEAMASGLPCVATDVGDVRTEVADAALVVPPDDVRALTEALDALLRDPAGRADLGRRARQRAVTHLNADLMARRTFGLLAALARPALAAPLAPPSRS